MTRSAQDLTGKLLGGCRLVRQVGRGASGAVYLALQESLRREVAVKVLRSQDPQALARFRREAEITSRLNSRNIAQVIDFGTTPEGLGYFIMELLHGEDLATRLARHGRLPVDATLHVVEQVARALRLAHDNHVVHRDLKPQNIFLHQTPDDGEIVKVIDFGVSRVNAGPRGSVPTDPEEFVGTPAFMAPEQVDPEVGDVDARTDVYALGAVTYTMLAGRIPYPEQGLFQLMARILAPEPPPPLHTVAPGSSPAVAAVVARALAKRPNERFDSVTSFFNDLRHAARAAEASAAPRPTAVLAGTQRVGTTYLTGKLVTPLWRKRRIPDELRFAVPEGGFDDGSRGARSLVLDGVKGELYVGRHPACELVLPHSRVSRRAVRLTLRAGRAQLCRLRECTVPVRVGPALLAPGEERPLHHGQPVVIGAVSGVFLDGRYVQPSVSPQDIDVESGLLGRGGLAWELALALRVEERARLLCLRGPTPLGRGAGSALADDAVACRVALAVHAAAPERPVGRIGGSVVVLLDPAGDAPAIVAAAERALRRLDSDTAPPSAPGPRLVAGERTLAGPSDEAGARLDETLTALRGASTTGAGRIVALAPPADRPLIDRATLEEKLASPGAERLCVLALRGLGPLDERARDALELELAELVAASGGRALCRLTPGVLACLLDTPSSPRDVGIEWRERGPIVDGTLAIDRVVGFALEPRPPSAPPDLDATVRAATGVAGWGESLPAPLAVRVRDLASAAGGADRAAALRALRAAATQFWGLVLACMGLAAGGRRALPPASAAGDGMRWLDALVHFAAALASAPPRVRELRAALVDARGSPRAALVAEPPTNDEPLDALVAAWERALTPLSGWALVAVERCDRLDWECDAEAVRHRDHTGTGEPTSRVVPLRAGLVGGPGVYLARLSEEIVVPLGPWIVARSCGGCRRATVALAARFRTEAGPFRYACAMCGAETSEQVRAVELGSPASGPVADEPGGGEG